MQLVLLTDIHGSVDFLPALSQTLRQADAVVVAGDITTFGNAEAALGIMESLLALNPCLLAVSGNCDQADVDDYLHEQGFGLHANCVQQEGIDFVGVSGSLPCPGSTPNELGESRFAKYLSQALDCRKPGNRPLVLISHQPAYGTKLDQTHCGGHTGSTALRDFIELQKPLLAISGHIHEATGVDTIGQCTLVNPGPLQTGHYALAEIQDTQVSVQFERVG